MRMGGVLWGHENVLELSRAGGCTTGSMCAKCHCTVHFKMVNFKTPTVVRPTKSPGQQASEMPKAPQHRGASEKVSRPRATPGDRPPSMSLVGGTGGGTAPAFSVLTPASP